MSSAQARSQNSTPTRRRRKAHTYATPSDVHFHKCDLTVDVSHKVVTLDFANVTLELEHHHVVGLINQLEVARDLISPPTPPGRTYAPKMSNY